MLAKLINVNKTVKSAVSEFVILQQITISVSVKLLVLLPHCKPFLHFKHIKNFFLFLMAVADFTWNDLLSTTEHFGRETDLSDYEKIDYKKIESDDKYSKFTHGSHVLIFARTNDKSFKLYDRKAIVLMQMRFDGYLGFPGGLVDPGETPVEAVNRELKEEVGIEQQIVSEQHHQFTHVNKKQNFILHFYAVEVSKSEILEFEKNSLTAHDHGEESLGMVQVPLYTMGDAYRGFPSFLNNNFVGNAKYQLVETLVNLKILTKEYVIQALNAKPKTIT